MSLMACVFSKEACLKSEDTLEFFRHFGDTKTKPLQVFSDAHFALACSSQGQKQDAALELDHLIIAVSGYFIDFEDRLKEISLNKPACSKANAFCEYIYYELLRFGTQRLAKLSGAFTIVIYNKLSCELLVVNDKYGLFPLYIYDSPERLYLCNEYEPFRDIPGFPAVLDQQAVYEYFEGGMVLGDKTFFSALRQFPAGSSLQVTKGDALRIQKNSADTHQYQEGKVQAGAAEFVDIFRQGLISRLRTTEETDRVVTLSGGMDTRLMAGFIPEEIREKLSFLTFITPPLTKEQDSEYHISSQIANLLKLKLEVDTFDFWKEDFSPGFFEVLGRTQDRFAFTGHFGSEIFKAEFYSLLPDYLRKCYDKEAIQPIYSLPKKHRRSRSFWNKKEPSIFSSAFARTMPPFEQLLKEELAKRGGEGAFKRLSLELLTRSFFTDYWKGTRGLFHFQPQLIHKHFCVPFTDSRLLDLFLQIPAQQLGLGTGKFYNEIVAQMPAALRNIETNSNFANHEGTDIKFVNNLQSPFNNRNPKYAVALEWVQKNRLAHKNDVYNLGYLNRLISQGMEANPHLIRLIDFETWCRYMKVDSQMLAE